MLLLDSVKDPSPIDGEIVEDRQQPIAVPRSAHFVLAATIAASFIVMLLVGLTLWQGHRDARENARRSSENLLQATVGHVDLHMRLYLFALGLAADALNDPEFVSFTPIMKHRMLAAISQVTDFVGSILILDKEGAIVADSSSSEPRHGNFADRDYFVAQRDKATAGLFVSQPYLSRLRGGDPSFVVSRRISNPDGSFAGIVLIAVRLAFIGTFFSKIDMGDKGVLVMANTEGKILMRRPSQNDDGDVGTDIASSPNFLRIRAMGSGTFSGKASLDGVDRLYTFAHVAGTPMIVIAAVATQTIFDGWLQRVAVIGSIAAACCLGLLALGILLRRELIKRATAEADLAFLAITDALTGLANRRRFDDVIAREWRRTKRTGASLALLMIDADRFKELNDKFGHGRGDEVLRTLARVIDHSIRRPGDLGARYGGEEFAVVLPDTDAEGAVQMAETIRSRFALAANNPGNSSVPGSTVSIGVVSVLPTGEASVRQFIDAADAALYRAKSEGRNRVVLGS
ncbi:sensor domain-containing diguanylate cyclase [Xanthobacter sp. DSM 24535]|uniref:sensor domain-containing diguanylate cyclase n=1 Tax=Roseixanthobacter psychrophilus TaxID=3119917 RepID=UPI003729245F